MKNPINSKKSFGKTIGKSPILFLACLFLINILHAQRAETAVKGVLNLQNHNWQKQGIVDLNGQWEFYWNALYTPQSFGSAAPGPSSYAVVPGLWNSEIPSLGPFKPGFGYATYHATVLCPPSGEPLQLKFLTVASAYKLFVNGKQIAEVGKIGTTKATTIVAYQPAIFSVTPVNNKLDIVIQVANFNYSTGGLWDFTKLGPQPLVDTYRIENISKDFFIAGSFFLIGIFNLVIYFFFRRWLSPVYFAVFCFLIGTRALVTGELGINYITSWSWQFTKHIEFIFLYLTVPVMSLFSYELFPKEFPKRILRIILLVSAVFVGVALFASPFVVRYTLRPFQLFMLVTACYGSYVYTCAVKNKRIGSLYFLAGFAILFVAIINDILYTSLIIQTTNLLYVGLYTLVICQAAALSRQFYRAFVKIEKLNKQLAGVNNELNLKNETIHETNVRLNKLNEELDTLVFRTSHDLRSPITSVYAMADIIRIEPDAATRSQYLDSLKKTLMRLNALITDILRYSKNKSTALHYEKIDLDEFVKQTMQDHLFSDKSEKISRIVEVCQSVPFETDAARLSMVLGNLISNALKYYNKEESNPFVKVIARADQKYAEIEVTDNGQGIAQSHLDHIFTKFYRVNNTGDGSGLGLYIVKEAVEKLGGSIRIESRVNIGTTFFILLPNGIYQ